MNAVLNEDMINKSTNTSQATQDAQKPEAKGVTMTEEERKAEAMKRINASIDRHEPLLRKLAK